MVQVVQQWPSHTGEDRSESNIYSVHKPGCFCSLNLVLESWGIPGELLVFSLHWKPREPTSDSGEGSTGFTLQSRGRQAKSFFLPFVWQPLERYHPDSGSAINLIQVQVILESRPSPEKNGPSRVTCGQAHGTVSCRVINLEGPSSLWVVPPLSWWPREL